MKEITYNVGIYLRLSNDDRTQSNSSDLGESHSIENQRMLLTKYVKEHEWQLKFTYVDDGFSGTNFDRPGFQQMLSDIKDRQINLVIVKDLSRLGRDHIQVGQFTENILPAFGCRFIAVNNNVDTLDRNSSSNDMMGFLNLFNEFHSRDTSRKVKTVKKACAERGMFLGTYAPYGYIRDPNDRHKLIIDPQISPIVQRIFRLRSEGKGFRSIAVMFNDEHITTPRETYYQRKNAVNPQKESGFWNESTIKSILRNEVYIGNMVQGKLGTLSYKSRKIIKKDIDEWIRFEVAHEPLIEQKIWNQVCDMDNQKYKPRKRKEDGCNSPFTGLVRCADCGFKMRCRVEKHTNKKGEEKQYVSFICGNYSRGGKSACSAHIIYENVLNQLVLSEIREKAQFVTYNEEQVVAQILHEKNKESISRLTMYTKEIKVCESRLIELDHVIKTLYEDKIRGTVPDGIFKSLMQNYEAERKERICTLSEMQSKLNVGNKTINDVTAWAETIKAQIALESPETDVLLSLIESIEVSDPVKVDGKKTCNIKVIYRMIGDISELQLDKAVCFDA